LNDHNFLARTYANLEGLHETAWFEPIPGNETFEVLRFRE